MKDVFARVIDEIGKVFLGNREQVELALACLLAEGHLLLEDLPGLGKTTLARTLARVLRLEHDRVQFTADLLPGDILGMSVLSRQNDALQFHPGPIFTQVLLADEVNRATPRTQSALLEAMSEAQVTIDGKTRPLPTPFFVIATQNPVNQSGTYPLPESQLDRFLMRLSLGYPEPAAERQLLQSRSATAQSEPMVSEDWLFGAREQVRDCFLSDSVLDYLQRLIAYTRESSEFRFGLSPRGGIALAQAARAVAVLAGRDHVIPEDIQRVWVPVVAHRLQLAPGLSGDSRALVAAVTGEVDSVSRTA
jgi:MoxR-like ATPase